jgi:hypothetical protein
MNERFGADCPIKLHTVVQYWGERALIVGRAKPVNSDWQYDLLISREGRLVVVPGLLAEEFAADGSKAPAEPVVAKQPALATTGLH